MEFRTTKNGNEGEWRSYGYREGAIRLALHRIRAHYSSVVKNITLSADERLIEAARIKAQQERTTLNGAFRDWLARYAGKRMSPEEYTRLMEQMKHVSPGKKFARDELNER